MSSERPEQEGLTPAAPEQGGLGRFRSWHGFLVASLAVNALFVYGMLGNVADPEIAIWFKTLVWLPFNAIATALYITLALRLRAGRGGSLLALLCAGVAIGNWLVMLRAGS